MSGMRSVFAVVFIAFLGVPAAAVAQDQPAPSEPAPPEPAAQGAPIDQTPASNEATIPDMPEVSEPVPDIKVPSDLGKGCNPKPECSGSDQPNSEPGSGAQPH